MKRFQKLCWLAVIIILVMTVSYFFVPKPDLKNYHGYSRVFFDKNGQLLRLTLAADQRYRVHVGLDQIAAEMKAATQLYEDQGFYQHPGVDPLALVRAFWNSYVLRERLVGASTITMQVARLRWNLHTRSLRGKFTQILRALQLTRHYSKDEIFEAYLNLASFGRNIEGVEAASLIYFNKPARELSLPEALSLCVIPQNPVKRNPTTLEGYARLKVARNSLFERWVETRPDDYAKKMFFDLPMKIRAPEELPFIAPHFVNELGRRLPPLQYGRIDTALDISQQKHVARLLHDYISRKTDLGIVNGAVAILNHQTMELEAMVGSADFWGLEIKGQVNGTTAKRSPGSTLKPFVYALGMDQGLIHPMTMLKDSPRRFAGFTPENFDQEFIGPVFARDALITSRNVPAAELQSRLDSPSLYNWLQSAEIQGLQGEGHYGLALSLGGVELTMLELLKLYAVLPNGGVLKSIKMMRDEPDGEGVAVLSQEASYLTLDILKDNPAPSRPDLVGQVDVGPEIAWKTGTSFAFRDAWAIGISGRYVIAVWIGNFDGSSNHAFIGRTAAGPLLFQIMQALSRGRAWTATGELKPGLMNLSRVSVCSLSGDLPNRYCPHTTETWFIPGVSPIKVSTIHRAVPINPHTGLRACRHRPGQTEQRAYEFWPSDLLQIYRQAGISLKAPPDYEADCGLDDLDTNGFPPMITSPGWGVEYRLRSDLLNEERIPFMATVDADVKQVYWFVDDRYIGMVLAGEILFWTPDSGKFVVRVVDDHGRAAQMKISVALVKDVQER